jgi:tetratricopeptide (TPR) repeat protein
MPAAADLLERATELFDDYNPERKPALLGLVQVLTETGQLDDAMARLDEAERVAEATEDARMAANAQVLRLFLLRFTDPKRLSREALSEAEQAIAMLESLHDDLGVARAWILTGNLHWARARYASADEAFAQAIEYSRRAGAVREEAESLGMFVGSGTYGPAHVSEVERRCEEVISRFADTGHEVPALRGLAWARAMQGQFKEARELAARARKILEDFGMRLRISLVSETSGAIEMLAGDFRAAVREFQSGFDLTTEVGELGFRSTVAALLAHALFNQGSVDDAETYARISAEEAAEDDLASQVLWRTARARIAVTTAQSGDAEQLARDAVELVAASDDINMHADALVDLGEVLWAGPHKDSAKTALTDAIGLYEKKGNIVAEQATRIRRDGMLDR